MCTITLQKSLLHQQAWRQPEEARRDDVMKTGKRAFVLASPLYEREMPKLPRADEEHVIPSRYRRIIAVPAPQRTKDSHCMTGTFAPYEQPVTGIWQPALRSKAHTPSPPPTALAF